MNYTAHNMSRWHSQVMFEPPGQEPWLTLILEHFWRRKVAWHSGGGNTAEASTSLLASATHRMEDDRRDDQPLTYLWGSDCKLVVSPAGGGYDAGTKRSKSQAQCKLESWEGNDSMRKTIGISLALVLLFGLTAWAGLGSTKTMYVGGTVASLTQGTEGTSSTQDEKVFVFEYKGGKFAIPYDRINDLEYGQKAGRRLGLALTISPWILFSHKRKHYLTIGYKDENDKQQAGVFELGKNVVRVTLVSLEARTGRKVDYQDEEARKSGLGE